MVINIIRLFIMPMTMLLWGMMRHVHAVVVNVKRKHGREQAGIRDSKLRLKGHTNMPCAEEGQT